MEITGCPEAFQNEDNLFVQAYRRAEREMGVDPAPIRVHINTDVPVARGLGSSATLLAGGVTAANAMNGNPLTCDQMVTLCNELEGHPDNIAPAVLGGMCASLVEDGLPISVRVDVAPNVGFVALIPNFETETRAMRAVLPKVVPFGDAVFNASRLAVMLRGFEHGKLDLVGKAMNDRLHQPYRCPLIHEYDRAKATALQAGCAAFCVSGSGSTCLGVCEAGQASRIAAEVQAQLQDSEYGWRAVALGVDVEGSVATIL